jgi:hypothetical protein
MPPSRRTHLASTFVVLGVALALPAAAPLACDLSTGTTTPGAIATAAGACPNLASLDAVARVDFAREFGIDAPTAGRIKAGVEASLELSGFAASLDAKLRTACSGLATDLGARGTWENGDAACKAALTALADVKGQMGGSARLAVSVVPPRCAVDMSAMADCVAQCDASVEPGSVDVQCEKGKLAGTCEAQCSGTCEISGSAKCEGTCRGACDAQFSGRCGGACKGTCDGAAVDGAACAGRCVGSCSANAEGSCGGRCSGECQLSAAATCRGTCHGECSVEMKAPRCEGKMTPPKASAECNAKCETKLQAEVRCSPARVAVRIDGSANAAAAARLKAAVEKNLPAVLEIAVGMRDQALSVAGNVRTVIEGVQVAIRGIQGAPEAGARLAACVATPFSSAIQAAASVQANVRVSVDVQASASASGSARAG